MKVKYYLRGLGIGILVSVVIMSIASGRKTTMTDEEVKARAKELGMVESTVLSDYGNKDKAPEADPKEDSASNAEADVTGKETEGENTEQTTKDEETTKQEVETEEKSEEKEPARDDAEDEKKDTQSDHLREPDDETVSSSTTNTEKKYVSITISSGESSETVSRKLAEAGLVDSAKAYDAYLCQNGYDIKIRVGTYSILEGSSYEEIAVMLTTKNR